MPDESIALVLNIRSSRIRVAPLAGRVHSGSRAPLRIVPNVKGLPQNSKSEYRNSKQARKSKVEIAQLTPLFVTSLDDIFRISCFRFVSDFGIRYSDFSRITLTPASLVEGEGGNITGMYRNRCGQAGVTRAEFVYVGEFGGAIGGAST
jgi:hypothetical protein